MATNVKGKNAELVALACSYASGVVAALRTVEDEQQLYEGLVGAFLTFLEDALKEGLCQHKIGTPGD